MESLKLFFELNRADRSMKHKKKAMSLFKKKKDKNRDKYKERKHKQIKRKKKRKSKKHINKYKPFEGERCDNTNMKQACPPEPTATQSPPARSPTAPSPSPSGDSVSPSPMEDSLEMDNKHEPMTEEQFIAFMRRLTYYNLRYMNYKMIVGIDEQIITEDTRTVLTNIKSAIRFQIYNLLNVTPNSIVMSSKYQTDQIKIIELNQILKSIDETKPFRV